MKRLFFHIILLTFPSSCVPENATNDVVLSLPFGQYSNWTNYELKQLNFRIGDNELQIDTTYHLKLHEFKTHHSEKLEDYPAITKFLKKPVKELRDLQDAMNKVSCDGIDQFFIQYENGTKSDQIKFKGTDECDTTHSGGLSSVYREMKKLQDKYKPK